jgi:hypothetical protein
VLGVEPKRVRKMDRDLHPFRREIGAHRRYDPEVVLRYAAKYRGVVR